MVVTRRGVWEKTDAVSAEKVMP